MCVYWKMLHLLKNFFVVNKAIGQSFVVLTLFINVFSCIKSMIQNESVKFGCCFIEFINVLYPIGMFLIKKELFHHQQLEI